MSQQERGFPELLMVELRSEIKYILSKLNLIKSDNVSLYYRKLDKLEKKEMDNFLEKFQSHILNNK